jgi:hypothetical protein
MLSPIFLLPIVTPNITLTSYRVVCLVHLTRPSRLVQVGNIVSSACRPTSARTHQTSVVQTLQSSFKPITAHKAAFLPAQRSAASFSVLLNSNPFPPNRFVTFSTPCATSFIRVSDPWNFRNRESVRGYSRPVRPDLFIANIVLVSRNSIHSVC